MAEQQTNGATPTRDAMRSQVIADLDRIASGAKPEVKAQEAPQEAPKEEPAPEEPQEAPEAEEPEEPAVEEPEEPSDEQKDPDLAKRLAIVAKHEKRAKEREAKAKAELDQERAAFRRERDAAERELHSMRSEIQEFSKLKERAKYDPAGVLRALGLGDDDIGPAARHLWSHDPKNKDRTPEAAAAMMQRREQEERISKLEKEIEARNKADKERETRERVAASTERYLDGITKAIKADDHPLAKRLIEKAPDSARNRFAQIALELSERDDGDLPDADDVLAEYERRRRSELELDGVDVAAMLKRPTGRPKADGPSTLGADVTTATAPKRKAGEPKKSQAELRAELEAELRAMDSRSR